MRHRTQRLRKLVEYLEKLYRLLNGQRPIREGVCV